MGEDNKKTISLSFGVNMHMPNSMSRRYKAAYVPLTTLGRMLIEYNNGKRIVVKTGVREQEWNKIGIIGGTFDHTKNMFVVFIAAESFEEVRPGEEPGVINVDFDWVDYGQKSTN